MVQCSLQMQVVMQARGQRGMRLQEQQLSLGMACRGVMVQERQLQHHLAVVRETQ
jgi:hypothetical protein